MVTSVYLCQIKSPGGRRKEGPTGVSAQRKFGITFDANLCEATCSFLKLPSWVFQSKTYQFIKLTIIL